MFYLFFTIIMFIIIAIYIYKLFYRSYKPSNRILFAKLKKEYIGGCDDDDIKDLISFLYNELRVRNIKKKGVKNENKKKR